jgi:hypothetical protein
LQVPEDPADEQRADDEQRRAAVQDVGQPRAPGGRVRRRREAARGLFVRRRLLRGKSPAFYVLHVLFFPCTVIFRPFPRPKSSPRK